MKMATPPHWLLSCWMVLTMMSACTVTPSEPALAIAPTSAPQARIAFANHGGIRNWQAVGDDALLIEGTGGVWYLARLQGVGASDLAFVEAVAFITDPGGSLGQFDAVLIKGRRYTIASLTKTSPPK